MSTIPQLNKLTLGPTGPTGAPCIFYEKARNLTTYHSGFCNTCFNTTEHSCHEISFWDLRMPAQRTLDSGSISLPLGACIFAVVVPTLPVEEMRLWTLGHVPPSGVLSNRAKANWARLFLWSDTLELFGHNVIECGEGQECWYLSAIATYTSTCLYTYMPWLDKEREDKLYFKSSPDLNL